MPPASIPKLQRAPQPTPRVLKPTARELPLLHALLIALAVSLGTWGILFFAFPVTDDAYHAAFRAVELDYCASHGELLAENAPHLYSGRGSPLFQYYGPLASWVVLAFHTLLGTGSASSTNAATLLFVLIGAAGVFHLSRRWFTPQASAFAALCFALSPYLLADAFRRGALSEMAAIALFPWGLLALEQLATPAFESDNPKKSPSSIRGILHFTLIQALLVLSHPPLALMGTIVFAFYALIRSRHSSTFATRHPFSVDLAFLARALAGSVLGLMLSAYYWLPALLQTNFIRLDTPAPAEFYTFLLPLHTILLPPLIDAGPLRVTLGLFTVFACILGYFSSRSTPNGKPRANAQSPPSVEPLPSREWLAFTLVLVVLCTTLSQPFWSFVPFLHSIQFPWRLLGLTLPFTALLAASAYGWFREKTISRIPRESIHFLLLALVTFAASAPFLMNLTLYSNEPAWSTAFIQNNGVTGTYRDEYAPRDAILQPNRLSQPLQGEIAALSINSFAQTCTTYRASFTNPLPQTLTARLFHYPYWSATLDGQPITLQPAKDGLASLPLVLPGSHELSITFAPTPLQNAARLASVAALTLLLVLTLINFKRSPKEKR